MDRSQANDDPIRYVLQRLWEDATANGQRDAALTVVHLCNEQNYPEAMMLAVAMVMDREKRSGIREREGFVVEEWAKRELVGFLIANRSSRTVVPKIGPPKITVEQATKQRPT